MEAERRNKRTALIIVSGGMDSVTMLYDYQSEIALALSFDYGSKHNERELPLARMHAERLGIEHLTVPLDFIKNYFKSDLLVSGGEIPTGTYNEENMASTVVPFRNGIMLAIAAGLAESRELDRIFIANHFGDHSIYPDCRASFVEPMAMAIEAGTKEGISLEAPYTGISKTDIAQIGKRLQLNYAETWSCYNGYDEQCGCCSTCLERREALREAQIQDSTPYKCRHTPPKQL